MPKKISHYVGRPVNSFKERGFAPYVTAIGRSTLAWNSLHDSLGAVFSKLITANESGGGSVHYVEERSLAAWQSIQIDRVKRAALIAVIVTDQQAPLPQHKGHHVGNLKDILWLLAETNKLEDMRNNAIHAPLLLIRKRYTKLDPPPGTVIPGSMHLT